MPRRTFNSLRHFIRFGDRCTAEPRHPVPVERSLKAEADEGMNRTSQGAGLSGPRRVCAFTARLDPRICRTLPDGSANPPGPWRSGIAVHDTGTRTTRRNKQRQRSLRSKAIRQPGGSDGDGTAQPCSDPETGGPSLVGGLVRPPSDRTHRRPFYRITHNVSRQIAREPVIASHANHHQ